MPGRRFGPKISSAIASTMMIWMGEMSNTGWWFLPVEGVVRTAGRREGGPPGDRGA